MGERKRTFQVEENETIEECLKRMEKAGYTPIRRTEKPIFQEVITNGKKEKVPVRQQIIFEGIRK